MNLKEQQGNKQQTQRQQFLQNLCKLPTSNKIAKPEILNFVNLCKTVRLRNVQKMNHLIKCYKEIKFVKKKTVLT